jgi:hypothetical protein
LRAAETKASPGQVEAAGGCAPEDKAGGPVAVLAGISVAVLAGALAVGDPSYDAVLAEHTPLMADGESCRACGFVYTGRPAYPAVILAEAGHADLADRVRVVPEGNRDYGVLCELTVPVERMGARLDVIGAHVLPAKPAHQPRHRARPRRVFGLPRRRRLAVGR